MSQTTPPADGPDNFETWANLFNQCRAFGHPSELHGGLCGRLATGARLAPEEWLGIALEQMGLPTEAAAEQPELAGFMAEVQDEALARLKAADLSFSLLLPDDDYSLEQRVQSLAAWVQGFLEGMAVTAGARLGEAPDEIRELIEDMVAISQVEEDAASEEAEFQLHDLTEYVRMGVLSVFTEFNPPDTPKNAGGNTLH